MNAIVERAKLARLAALKTRSTLSNQIDADPPKPATFPAQTLLPDLRIPISSLTAALDYLVPKPSLEDEDDAFQPQIRKKGDTTWIDILPGQFQFLGPVADRDWNVPFQIPRSFLKEELTPETPTEWEFRYVYYAGGTNDVGSDMSTFAIDLTAPYKVKNPPADRTPGAATWPSDLGPTVPINDEYIEGKTGIIVKPPIPANFDKTDVYQIFFGPAPDPERDTPVFEGELSDPGLDAEIPVKVFVDAADGPQQLVYRSRDLAGNVGRRSNFSQRTVQHAKDPDPDTIKPPVVTLANGVDGDNLIDLKDTQFDARGVEIKVSVPTPNSPSDTITCYWAGQEAGVEQRVGTNTELAFYAPYSLIKQVYGNTDGIVVTNVSYQMFRGVRQLGGDEVDIDVDISFIGPDPITIGLVPPTLTTTAGSADEIKEGDYGDAAITAHINLFAAPPTEEGWLIDLFYDDIKIGDTIPLTPGQEGTTLDRVIPWEIIQQQNSGDKVLRYLLHSLNTNNPTDSAPKTIPVEPFPIEMLAPEILNLAGPARRIGCATLNFPTATNPGDGTARRNLLVRVLPNVYTVDGETITVKFQGWTKTDPPVPIPNTDAEATYDIIGTYPSEGATIGVGDYEEDFKPSHLSNGRVTYSISRSGTTPTPDSLPAMRELDLDDSEGRFCEEFIPTP
ncbi:hypothetical protein [Pseudomonas sp. NPDC087615]|uniref:hypothetical protein n=1 Tax=Pseudomonas sp. NPDC087615 TaxID=3364443 RepID=UPI00380D5A92